MFKWLARLFTNTAPVVPVVEPVVKVKPRAKKKVSTAHAVAIKAGASKKPAVRKKAR